MKRASSSPSRAPHVGRYSNSDPSRSTGLEDGSLQDLQRLYEVSVLEHSKNPRNRGKLDAACDNARGYNPLCGDEITVYFDVSTGRLERISFESSSCAICTAAASHMTIACRGRRVAELRGLLHAMEVIVSPHKDARLQAHGRAGGASAAVGRDGGRGPAGYGRPGSLSEQGAANGGSIQPAVLEALRSVLDEVDPALESAAAGLQVFAGLRNYPLRAQCAMLPWRTLVEAVAKA